MNRVDHGPRQRRGSPAGSVSLRSGIVCAGLALALVTMGACGSRGPLDADPPPDAGTPDSGVVDDAAPDVGPPDTAAPIDAGRESGGTILECGSCLFSECSDKVLACVQDTKCRTIFQCVVTDCLAGGGSPSPACMLGCANGDISGGLKILAIFTCVTGTCGPDCGSLLGGLLGGLGGGGGSSGGGSSGAAPPAGDAGKSARSLPPIVKAFSHWPELCGPLEADDSSMR